MSVPTTIEAPKPRLIGFGTEQSIALPRIIETTRAIQTYEPAIETTRELISTRKTDFRITCMSGFFPLSYLPLTIEKPLLGKKISAWFFFGQEGNLFSGVIFDGIIQPVEYNMPNGWFELNEVSDKPTRNFTWGIPKYGVIVRITTGTLEVDLYTNVKTEYH